MASIDTNELKKDIEVILTNVAKVKNIQNYELIPNLTPHVADGFVAQFFTGKVRNKDTGEITDVAIKKAPVWELEYINFFKNEGLFYSTIFPSLDTFQRSSQITDFFENAPTFFCAGFEPKKEYIALENLSPFGYVMFDKKEYLNKEHLEFIFKTYGKFHAISFVLRQQNFEKYQEIHIELVDIYQTFADALAKPLWASLNGAVDALDPNSPEYDLLKDLPENAMENFVNAAKYTGNYRCSTHGDCWSNNMLFKYNDSGKLEDIKLLDFQLVRDGTPVHDLSYFFYSGASKPDIENIEYYLKVYHNSLSEVITNLGGNPDELFPFHILLKEWKENALLGIFMGIYLWQIKLSPKHELAEIMSDKKRSEEEKMKLFEVLMAKMYKSDAYKERTSALLIHAVDYGVVDKNRIIKKSEEGVTKAENTEA